MVESKFRKGKQLIKDTAENKGSRRFTPNIYWNNGDVKTVAFVTPADEIPKVRLHQAVRIPDDKMDKGYRMENFLCQKDPSMITSSNGSCILCDHIGHDASERFVALAVELEPIKEGKMVKELRVKHKTVKRDDGTEVDYPQWGMVIQGAKNFFSWLAAYDESKADITTKAFEIHREGDSIGTKYHFFAEDVNPPDLTETLEGTETLEELLEEMGSEEKYSELKTVEPGSQPSFGSSPPRNENNIPSSLERDAIFDRIKGEVGAVSDY